MKVLEDLLAVAYLRFKEASRAQTDSDPTTDGVLAATARAYADVATAIATHKHAKTDPEYAREAIGMFLRDAEAAELVAIKARDRARQLRIGGME